MKKIYSLFFLITVVSAFAVAQQQLINNGSFENNSAANMNRTNLTTNWPTYVANSWQVSAGTMDLIKTDPCGVASNATWYVKTTPQGINGPWPYMSFSLQLLNPTIQGSYYKIKFDKRYCGPNTSPIDIGLSADSTQMGTIVNQFTAPQGNTWVTDTFIFQAPLVGRYISINVGVAGTTGQISLDNFKLIPLKTSIDELHFATMSVFPNPVGDKLNIGLINPKDEEFFQLCDIAGRTIREYPVSGLTKQTLDVSYLTSGVYFLNIKGKHPQTIKIVKL